MGRFQFTRGLHILNFCSTSRTVWKLKNGTHEEKNINERYKIIIIKSEDLFKNEMGLLINKVKTGGSGTSNDGNTAGNKKKKIYNLLELLVSTKILFADFM